MDENEITENLSKDNFIPRNNVNYAARRLEGRKALVTGASKGIGREIAIALATEGADVAINYQSSDIEAARLSPNGWKDSESIPGFIPLMLVTWKV